MHRFLTLFLLLFVGGVFLPMNCTYPSPEKEYQDFEQQLDSQFCIFFNQDAILHDIEAAYWQLPIPDSAYWSNRTAFAQFAQAKFKAFPYLFDAERAALSERDSLMQSKLLLAQDTSQISKIDIYSRYPVFQHIIQHPHLSETKKLQAIHYQLANYPFLLKTLPKNLEPSAVHQIPLLEKDLVLTHRFLTEQLADSLRLHHQLEHIREAIMPKIEHSRRAIKNALSYCRSFENQHTVR